MAAIHNRFKEAQWFNPDLEVIVGGLGGIGSNIVIPLARQDFKLYLYDHDFFELHNAGCQNVKASETGLKKTLIAKKNAFDYANNNKVEVFDKYEKDSLVSNIMISCFDNMEARATMFNNWCKYQLSKTFEYRKENSSEINIFIDGRMLMEQGQVYVVDSKARIEMYQNTLFSDNDIEDQPCSMRATTHTGMFIASLMTSLLLNKIANKKLGFDLREIPFKTTFDLITMNICSI